MCIVIFCILILELNEGFITLKTLQKDQGVNLKVVHASDYTYRLRS